jgi:hypothetical protein
MSPALAASQRVSASRSTTSPWVNASSGVSTWRTAIRAGAPANGIVRHSRGEIVIVTGPRGSAGVGGGERPCCEYTWFGFAFCAYTRGSTLIICDPGSVGIAEDTAVADGFAAGFAAGLSSRERSRAI